MLEAAQSRARRDHRGQDPRPRHPHGSETERAGAKIQSASERSASRRRAHHAALFELRRRRRISLASSRLAEGACRRTVRAGAVHPRRHRAVARLRPPASLRRRRAPPRRGVDRDAAEDAKAAPAWPEGARVGIRRLPRLYVAGEEEHAPRRLLDWLKRQAHLDLKTPRRPPRQASQSRAEAALRARPDHALGIVLDLGRAVLLLAARARAALRARLSRRARGRSSRPHESRAPLLGSRRAHHAAPSRKRAPGSGSTARACIAMAPKGCCPPRAPRRSAASNSGRAASPLYRPGEDPSTRRKSGVSPSPLGRLPRQPPPSHREAADPAMPGSGSGVLSWCA